MNRSILLIIFIWAVFNGSVLNCYSQRQTSVDSLKKHIKYLASEELKGRKAGTLGDSLAAIYIANAFSQAGLIPLCENGFQEFSLVRDVKPGPENSLYIQSPNGEKNEYIPGIDFQPFSFSTSTKLSSNTVFGGFGITAETDSIKWDDYSGIDPTGKWIVILRGDPEPDNPESQLIPLASDRAKAINAKDRNAAGVLLVSPSSIERADKPIDITFDKSVSDAGLPVISITRKVAAEILGLPVTAIDSIEKVMLTKKSSVNFPINSIITASTDIVRERAISRNVVFELKSSGGKLLNENIVIGAHYDHLGMGGEGSGSRVPDEYGIHYGADDNASGVASLIELAYILAAEPDNSGRNILFVAFGAEEMGIIGSRYFTDHSPVPTNSIKAMINLDMVGRLNMEDPIISISGTGTSNVTDSIVNIVEKERMFSVKKIPDGYGPSDHASFYTAGIPVFFITTGAHGDYHTPEDTYAKINYEGQKQVTEFVADIAGILKTIPQAPVFAQAGSKRESGRYGRNLKVTLGIMPDVSGAETSGGMKVEGTRKGAPADKAGMKKGDIITAINGMKVTNIYDYMTRLGKLKPGDVANVEILRDNKVEILIIQL